MHQKRNPRVSAIDMAPTSVQSEDLSNRGAKHLADCVSSASLAGRGFRIVTLVADFPGRVNQVFGALSIQLPDVFDYHIEVVPCLCRKVRPGAGYRGLPGRTWRSTLLVPTKSGLVVCLGEAVGEVRGVMYDLRQADCGMLTIGLYLAPSDLNFPVERYYTFEEFDALCHLFY